MKQREVTILVAALLILPIALAQQNAQQDTQETKTADAVRAGGSTYFTAKLDNLTQTLRLTPDQQTKIKPIAEQEVAYLEQIRANPVASRQEKLKRLKDIVQTSDTQMKPVLSPEQWQKLQTLRKQQKEQLKQYATASKTASD